MPDVTPFDVVVVIGALCGLLMVLGSMYLLRLGIIDLKTASSSPDPDALAVIVKEIKITSRYPALGLFVIGLAFIMGVGSIARPHSEVLMLPITASVTDDEGRAIQYAEMHLYPYPREVIIPIAGGRVEKYPYIHRISPPNIVLRGTVAAPGFSQAKFALTHVNGTWTLQSDLRLSRVVDNVEELKPPQGDRKIASEEPLATQDDKIGADK
jgi:hypothetical protein